MTSMQIVIPMSGFGERFRAAGYAVPKPLIPVDGKPIIAHVAALFPGERDITFICNADHLADPRLDMAAILRDCVPTAKIVGIAPHGQGPIGAVLAAELSLDPDRPVFVNYCDFGCDWSWADFQHFVRETACDGAIPAYRGFHPHSLGSTYYAYLRTRDGWVTDIQEKQPFTATPMHEFASSGGYYFRTATLMREAFARTVRDGDHVNGEFYVSLAYRPLLADGRSIAVYELDHFLQWGTPDDLCDYQAWSTLFAALAKTRTTPRLDATTIMPMAGAGLRFLREGFVTPKPLIPVSGAPMVLQAMADLPQTTDARVVVRSDMPGAAAVQTVIETAYPQARFVALAGLTEGQALSCLAGLDGEDDETVLVIGACDNGLVYDGAALERLLQQAPDVVAFGVRGHRAALRKPDSYGWIATDGTDRVTGVRVKAPLSDPARDPVVTGAFIFRRAGDFRALVAQLIAEDRRVNGEFYVDSLLAIAIERGLEARLFEVDGYIGWGTPDELRTFEYWQGYFHGASQHAYRIEDDGRVPAREKAGLIARTAPRAVPRPVGALPHAKSA